MANFAFIQKMVRAIKGKKNLINHGYSMGFPQEKMAYDQTALGMRLWVTQVENKLKNNFAKSFGAFSYADTDENTKRYISAMAFSRMKHYEIDKLAQKTEACFNEKNLMKFSEQVKKMYRISEEEA